jgi:hypothetical protein
MDQGSHAARSLARLFRPRGFATRIHIPYRCLGTSLNAVMFADSFARNSYLLPDRRTAHWTTTYQRVVARFDISSGNVQNICDLDRLPTGNEALPVNKPNPLYRNTQSRPIENRTAILQQCIASSNTTPQPSRSVTAFVPSTRLLADTRPNAFSHVDIHCPFSETQAHTAALNAASKCDDRYSFKPLFLALPFPPPYHVCTIIIAASCFLLRVSVAYTEPTSSRNFEMFFRNLICTVTLATLASVAVAKQIPTPYTSEQSESNSEEVFEREAKPEPARTAAWEEAHGGPAPTYHYGEEYGEDHDASAWHIAREANPMAEAEAEPGWANVGGNRQKKPGRWGSWVPEGVKKPFTKGGPAKFKNMLKNHARDEADGPDDEDVDDNEAPAGLLARDPRPEDLDIPDFGDQVVDTSLKGLLDRRDDDDDEEDGYDGEQTELPRRSDGTADEIDYSLEGYEGETFENEDEEKEFRLIQARDLAEDQVTVDDEYLHSDEHREFLASHGVTERSFGDDLQDAEHDRIDARGVPFPDFGDQDVDTSLEGMYLPTRDVDGEDAPDYYGQDIDFSLEGYDEAVVQARGVDEQVADAAEEGYDPDAAYADAEVVEEFTAPTESELE